MTLEERFNGLVEIVKKIAYEQATREWSGEDWLVELTEELDRIKVPHDEVEDAERREV